MLKFILTRLGYMLITIFCIATVTFFLMRSIPGDPLASIAQTLPEQTRENYYAKYGLDQPLFVQYLNYMKNLVRLDFGDSIVHPGRSVSAVIAETSPVSGIVGLPALAIGLVLGVLFGIIAALFKNKWPDYVVMVIAILGITIPVFVLAALLQYFFAVKLHWLPTSGWGQVRHTIIPIIVLSFGTIATYARYIKSSMLDTLGQDYILTARVKGLSEAAIIRRHVLRNSILPAVTLLSARIVGIFTGSFVIERMFAIPGIGFYYIDSINNYDYSMTMGLTIFYGALFVISQIVVDIVYVLIDPRIRLGGGSR